LNILITGGLLGLAVVAIIGAILLGMDEQRSKREPKDTISGHPETSAPTPRPKRVVPPARPTQVAQQPEDAEMAPTIPMTPLLTQPVEIPPDPQREPITDLGELNGQVQEIAGEVRALAQHAGELEQRLNHLSTLIEGNQRPQPLQHKTPANQFTVPKTDLPMQ
jgi:hypothetical protein